jgi:DNA-binding CsgD family transcriptional regulator/tetratricopeptide (TPR) repeat protein
VAKLLAGAGGNPFLVTTIAEAAGGGDLDPGDPDADDDGERDDLPLAPARLITHRMVDRGPGQLGLARRLAVLDRPAAVGELARFLDVPVRQAVATVEEMTGSGLLVDGPDGVHFAQQLVARALRIDLGPSVRTALHRELGEALAATGAPMAEVSRHLAAGATHGDRDAIEWLLRSAHGQAGDAGAGGWAAAVATLRRARRLASGTPLEDEVDARLARTLTDAGRFGEATRLATDGLEKARSPLTRATFLEALSDVALARGQNHRAIVLLEQTHLVDGLDRVRRARVVARLAAAQAWAFHVADAARNGDEAVAEGSVLGLTDVAAIGWSVRSRLASLHGDSESALDCAQRALTLSTVSGDGALRAFTHHMAGLALANADRFDEAAEVFEQGATAAAAQGDRPGEIRCLSALTVLEYQRGDWDDAIEHGRQVNRLSRDMGASLGVNLASGLLGLIALHRGDPDAAARRLVEGLAERDDPEANPAGHLAVAELALRLTTLRDDDAVGETVDQVLDLLDEHLATAPVVLVFVGLDLVSAAMRLGRVERARAVVDALDDVAARAGTSTSTGLAKVCRGLVAGDARLALSGVEEIRRSPHVMVRARALAETGFLALRLGAPGGAELVEEAAAAFTALRAVSDLDGLRRAAAGAGVGLDDREVTHRAEDGWERLTPAEREVLALLAEGLSNSDIAGRLFVSRRTVETHVSRIYAKSGIANRVLLAQEAHRRRARSGR